MDEILLFQNKLNTQEVSPIRTKKSLPSSQVTQPTLTAAQIAFLQAKHKGLRDRLNAPLMLVNTTSNTHTRASMIHTSNEYRS